MCEIAQLCARPDVQLAAVLAPVSVSGFHPPQTQHYFLLCFLLKFSLTITSCLICFGFTLQSFCDSARVRNLTNCSSVLLRRWVPPSPPPGSSSPPTEA